MVTNGWNRRAGSGREILRYGPVAAPGQRRHGQRDHRTRRRRTDNSGRPLGHHLLAFPDVPLAPAGPAAPRTDYAHVLRYIFFNSPLFRTRLENATAEKVNRKLLIIVGE